MYRVKTGARGQHYIATAGVPFGGNPWAHIFVDCQGTCQPQQSIGLLFDSNAEADAFLTSQAHIVFREHGWLQISPEDGWICPACQQRA